MEAKGAFAKAVQKTLVRTKAKVLQNLGKAEKTTDERFEDHVTSFLRQQAVALRLQKEVRHYIQCVKAMTLASRSLYTVIRDTCEPDWVDLHAIDASLKSLDILFSNYEAELEQGFYTDLSSYVEQFNPVKEKISKRRRKLLDYDNAKHQYESTLATKKVDELRARKASESLQEAERCYNSLNSELHEELPQFYNYRIDFLATNLSQFYSTETNFHLETGKLTQKLNELMEQVTNSNHKSDSFIHSKSSPHALQNNRTKNSIPSHRAPTIPEADDYVPMDDNEVEEYHYPDTLYEDPEDKPPADRPPADIHFPVPAPRSPRPTAAHIDYLNGFANGEQRQSHEDTVLLAEAVVIEDNSQPSNRDHQSDRQEGPEHYVMVDDEPPDTESSAVYENVENQQPSSDNNNSSLIGQQVISTHAYRAEDEDELTFEAGEIITIVEFDDPDDQDEGWLMGISATSGRRGVFPANFTRKIKRRNL